MYYKFLSIFCLIFIFYGCGDGSTVTQLESPNPDELISDDPPSEELEILNYQDGNDGETVLRVQTNIHSKDDLMAYKAQKIAEIEEILEITEEQSAERPYYPAVITMNKPVSLADLRKMLSEYNPTVAKALKSATEPVRYLPKAQLVPNLDTFVINSVKFVSTRGGGQFTYETLTHEKELSKLEKQISVREKELNEIDNYQLIRGVTSIHGGIHRDSIIPMQDDPHVFLTDIGPMDIYEGNVDLALWEDVYNQAEEYLNQ